METSFGVLFVKIFKTVLCARPNRAGQFNVHQANLNNLNLDRINGFIVHKNDDLQVKNQVNFICVRTHKRTNRNFTNLSLINKIKNFVVRTLIECNHTNLKILFTYGLRNIYFLLFILYLCNFFGNNK